MEARFYGEELGEAEQLAESLGLTQEVPGRWVRSQQRPTSASAQDFLSQLQSERPELLRRQWVRHRNIWSELIAVIVPEEVSWRKAGETILFLLLELKNRRTPKGKG